MSDTRFLEELLTLLANNKRFPKYQFERRIDIFFNFFLGDVLARRFGAPISLIIPEFPLKAVRSSLATNIDYLAYSRSVNTVYMCEFKTDPLSFRQTQLDRYELAQREGWTKIIEDVQRILQDTSESYREKYQHLIAKSEPILSTTKLKIVYFAPNETKKHLQSALSNPDVIFISLEELRTMDFDTPFSDEWDLVKRLICP